MVSNKLLLLQRQLVQIEKKFKCARCQKKAHVYLIRANKIKQQINKLKQETV